MMFWHTHACGIEQLSASRRKGPRGFRSPQADHIDFGIDSDAFRGRCRAYSSKTAQTRNRRWIVAIAAGQPAGGDDIRPVRQSLFR